MGKTRSPAIWLLGFLLLLGVAAVVYYATHKTPALSDREIATQFMAEKLKASLHPKGVLVIANPFSQKPGSPALVYEFDKAGIAGVRRGCGKDIPVKVAFPTIAPEVLRNPGAMIVDPKTTTPLSFLVSPEAFDQAIKTNADCDLVVSLIGLPVNLLAMPSWTKTGPPRFALLLPDCRMIGDLNAVRAAFASGKLAAAVLPKPGANPNAANTASGDYRAKFDAKFILVTPQNADEMIARAPRLFSP